ncbi:meiosis-specific nuclear structural protein 1-like [Paramacrobiotus metropolitanus]|uniref:meiosis-specific nuclear structural protein 1-like n=1 Tax=Paramacrobiotus metropolitanus TaxID=2943436 RepID=UPI0024459AEC|nr:meiosis-specific nuclear structural protein 1-like [Paramacrobiotus metropolitanus]
MCEYNDAVLLITEEQWQHIKGKPEEIHTDIPDDGLIERARMAEESRKLKAHWSNTLEVNMRKKALMKRQTKDKLEHEAVKLEEECERGAEDRAREVIQYAQRLAVKNTEEMRNFQKALSLAEAATYWKAQCEHNQSLREKRQEMERHQALTICRPENEHSQLKAAPFSNKKIEKSENHKNGRIAYLHERAEYMKEYNDKLRAEDAETEEDHNARKCSLRQDYATELDIRQAAAQQTMEQDQLENQIRKNYIQMKLERAINLRNDDTECQNQMRNEKVTAATTFESTDARLNAVIDTLVRKGVQKQEEIEAQRDQEKQNRTNLAYELASFNKQLATERQIGEKRDLKRENSEYQKMLETKAKPSNAPNSSDAEVKAHQTKELLEFWDEQKRVSVHQREDEKTRDAKTAEKEIQREKVRTEKILETMDREIEKRRILGWNIAPMLRAKQQFEDGSLP